MMTIQKRRLSLKLGGWLTAKSSSKDEKGDIHVQDI